MLQLGSEPNGVDIVLEAHHDVIGVPHDIHLPLRTSGSPLLYPQEAMDNTVKAIEARNQQANAH